MSSNIIATQISDKIKRDKDITRNNITATCSINAFPGIVIESEESLQIDNARLSLATSHLLLYGKTLIEVVKFLRDNGIDAWLTSGSLAGYPAYLLQDFRSHTPIKITPDTSPLRLSEIHSISSNNLVTFSEDNIDRELIQVWKNDMPTTNYELVNDLLFFDDISNVVCVLKYKINKYFLFCGKENVLNVSTLIQQHSAESDMSPELDSLLIKINSENKDVL